MSDLDKKVLDWFIAGETGMSSKCMASRLTGRDHDKSHPHDGGDFRRCLGLLDAVPELRERLPEMAAVSEYWAALIENWDAIEKKARAHDDDTYKFMASILHPIEDADPNVFRMGITSIRFGR